MGRQRPHLRHVCRRRAQPTSRMWPRSSVCRACYQRERCDRGIAGNILLFRGHPAELTLIPRYVRCALIRGREIADALAEAGVLTDDADDNSDPAPDIDSMGSVLGKPAHPRPLDIAGTYTGRTVHARLRRDDELPACPRSGVVLLSAISYSGYPCTEWYALAERTYVRAELDQWDARDLTDFTLACTYTCTARVLLARLPTGKRWRPSQQHCSPAPKQSPP